LEGDIGSRLRKACLFYTAHVVLILCLLPKIGEVVVRGESNYARFRKHFEERLDGLPPVLVIVKIGAVRLDTMLPMLTRVKFIAFGMIFLFLPPVAVGASILVRAAVLVVVYMILRAPIPALLLRVQIHLGFPSEVLPIVRIYTLVSLVVSFIVRTPDCLEVEDVKV
jgi:hypothetical protein